MRWLKWIIGFFLLVVITLLGVYLYLANTDLSRYQNRLETLVSDNTGRDFKINGRFIPEFSLQPKLLIENASLSSPAWAEYDDLVEIGLLEVQVQLLPLLRKKIQIKQLTLSDSKIFLQTSSKGDHSWGLPSSTSTEEKPSDWWVQLEQLEAKDLAITYLNQARELLTELELKTINARQNTAGTLVLSSSGTVNQDPLALEFTIDSLESLQKNRVFESTGRVTVGQLPVSLAAKFDTQAHRFMLDLQAQGQLPASLAALSGVPDQANQTINLNLQLDPVQNSPVHELTGTAALNNHQLQVEARASDLAHLTDSEFELSGSGPDLAQLAAGMESAAAIPYELTLSGAWRESALSISELQGQLGKLNLQGGGTLGFKQASEKPFTISMQADQLAEIAGILGLPEGFTNLPVKLEGTVHSGPSAYQLEQFDIQLGDIQVSLNGSTVDPHIHAGSQFKLAAEIPDLKQFGVLLDTKLPQTTLTLSGQAQPTETGLNLSELILNTLDMQLSANGQLSAKQAESRLMLLLDGEDLSQLNQIFDQALFTTLPFSAQTELSWNNNHYQANAIQLQLGDDKLTGDISIDHSADWLISAKLATEHLDLDAIRPPAVQSAEAKASTDSGKARLIPDTPLPLDALVRISGEIQLTATQLIYNQLLFQQINTKLVAKDGNAVLGPLSLTTDNGASIDAEISFSPKQDEAELKVGLGISKLPLNITPDQDSSLQKPPMDMVFNFSGRGESLHAIMAASNGHGQILLGEGDIDNNALGLLSADFLLELLDAINPFMKDDPTTRAECGVINLVITDGKMDISDIAVRTNKLTVVGNGEVDFASEDLGISFQMKTREGLGISASSVVNPFIQLGGTLAQPKVELNAAGALAQTGAALATGGVSLLAKGLFDRVSSETDVCSKALENTPQPITPTTTSADSTAAQEAPATQTVEPPATDPRSEEHAPDTD